VFADSDVLAAGASPFTTAVFVLVMVVAAFLDLKSRRIPNALTVSGAAIALILRAPLGWEALGAGLLGLGLGLLLTMPLFLVKALGGGDVKLMAAVGAFMGPGDLAGACLLIALVGGVLAITEAVRQGALRTTLINVGYIIVRWFSPMRRHLAPTLSSPTAMTIPYGVAIAVGALVWWFSGGSWLWASH
jgi:prepilin peptidase CpaA